MQLCLQPSDQIEHLRLDRGVEPRRRLVEDEQGRILRKRHRDHHALLHAARELMRVTLHHRGRIGNLDELQCIFGTGARVGPGDAANREHLRDLLADPDRRVQRSPGVLVDHRDVVRSQPPELAVRERNGVAPSDADPATGDAPVARQIPDNRERRRRLAATRFADEAVCGSPLDRQRHAANHLAVAAPHAVDDGEVVELERRCGFCSRLSHRSNTCCKPSAMRFTPTISVAIASAGNSTVHQ